MNLSSPCSCIASQLHMVKQSLIREKKIIAVFMPVSDPVSLFCVSVHVLKMTGSCRGTRNMCFSTWLGLM